MTGAPSQRDHHIVEHEQHHSIERGRLGQRLHQHINVVRRAIAVDTDLLERDQRLLAQGARERFAQGLAQSVARHGKQVQGRTAGCRFQVSSRPAAKIKHVALRCNQHGGRRIALQHHAVDERSQRGRRNGLAGLDDTPGLGLNPGPRARKSRRHRPQRRVQTPVDARLAPQLRKQVAGRARGLGNPEHQKAAPIETIVKQGQQLRLQRRLQVDQQVAAAQQIDPDERRIIDDVLHREDQHVTQLCVHPKAARVFMKKAIEPLLRHLGRDAAGIDAGARRGDGFPVQIRSKDLQRAAGFQTGCFQRLLEGHGQRVGLLAG